jgi:hypothetical protein
MTKEETITDIKRSRSEIYYLIMEYNFRPGITDPRFWVGYARVIDLWVEESKYRGFFPIGPEGNEDAVEDLKWMLRRGEIMGKVLGPGEAGEAGAEKKSKGLLQREDLKLRWI